MVRRSRKTCLGACLLLFATACAGEANTPTETREAALERATALVSKAERLPQSRQAEAQEAADGALQVRRQLLGDQHPDTWQAWNLVADIHERAGQLEPLAAALVQNIAAQEAALGATDLRLLPLFNRLAAVSERQDDDLAAERYYERARSVAEGHLDSDHPVVAEQDLLLANLYLKTCRGNLASPLVSRALATQERTFGSGSPRSAQAWRAMAEVLWQAGSFDGADQAMSSSILPLEQSATRTVEETRALLLAYNRWAEMYHQRESLDAAANMSNRMVDLSVQYFGVTDPLTLQLVSTRDLILTSRGDLAGADDALQRLGIQRIMARDVDLATTPPPAQDAAPVPRCRAPKPGDKRAVDNVVRAQSEKIANCYKKALRTYPNNTARLRVEALLDEKGNVLLASTYVPSAWVKSLAECTVLAYASVTFAPGERRLVVIPVHYATQ